MSKVLTPGNVAAFDRLLARWLGFATLMIWLAGTKAATG